MNLSFSGTNCVSWELDVVELGVGAREASVRARQLQARSQAAEWGSGERDAAAVDVGEVANDGQAKAGAGSDFVGAHAALQHGLTQRFRNARPVVFDRDVDRAVDGRG